MRFVRLARGRATTSARMIGALVTAAALSGVAGCADAVANSAGVWVSVSPATVNAGAQTQVTASCGENVNSATVSSIAFGSHTLQPVGGVLATTATVTPETAPGTYGVRLACATGSQATTTLTVIGSTSPGSKAPGPDTGGGFLAGEQETAELANQPADRAPLVWVGVGLSFLVAGALVAVRTKHKAAVRSRPHPSQPDDGTGPR